MTVAALWPILRTTNKVFDGYVPDRSAQSAEDMLTLFVAVVLIK